MKRVVVTGMSVITALGDDWDEFKSALIKGENAVVTMREWDKADGLNTRLAAPVTHFPHVQLSVRLSKQIYLNIKVLQMALPV